MIDKDDYPLLAEALRLAAGVFLDTALHNRHKDLNVTRDSVRKQMRCQEIAEAIERVVRFRAVQAAPVVATLPDHAPAVPMDTPALLRRQAE